MTTNNKNQRPRIGTLSLGVVLMILGVLFLLGRLIDINVGRFVWPFFIIMPGALLFVCALIIRGTAGGWLAAFGSMVTMTGMLLLYQNTFDHFESWAYGWALVAPTSIGLGKMVYGSLEGHQPTIRAGKRLANIGGAIFIVGAIFFELIIGISGFGLGRLGLGSFAWTIVLIGLGIFFILRGRLQVAAPTQARESTGAEGPTQEQIQR